MSAVKQCYLAKQNDENPSPGCQKKEDLSCNPLKKGLQNCRQN
jgi:hypothetical protein